MMALEKITDALSTSESEAALLGALMIENKLIDQAADIVSPEDFSEPLFGRVYSLMLRERSLGRTANVITLQPYLRDDPAVEAMGGPGFLAQLTGSGAALIGAIDFARQVRDLGARRRLVNGLSSAVDLAGDMEATTQQIVDAADAAIVDSTVDRDTIHQVSGAQCMDELLASYEQEVRGVTCRVIEPIDNLLGELRPKQLVIGAGRPGMGKTAVALSYALGAAQGGHGVLFVSLEMGSIELAQRMAADLCFDGRGGISFNAIRDNQLTQGQRMEIARARQMMADVPFHVVDAGHMTIGRLAMLVRRYKRRLAARGQSLDLVVVDYLQLLSPDGRARSNYEAVSEVSRGLKVIAKDNDLAVLALAQLSRSVEQRADKRPMLSDLRDSGQIEQDADAVLFLYRHEYYLRQSEPEQGTAEHISWQSSLDACRGSIEFICAKRRNGQTGNAQGRFHAAFQAVRS